jgi:hypothetical protein
MTVKQVAVRRTYKVMCDCCGVAIRGRTSRRRRPQFEFFLWPYDKDHKEARGFRFLDIGTKCEKRFYGYYIKIYKMLGARSRELREFAVGRDIDDDLEE